MYCVWGGSEAPRRISVKCSMGHGKVEQMSSKLIVAVAVFFAFILFIYMPLTYLIFHLKDRKGRAFAEGHNAVKFYIRIKKHGGNLEVISINGQKPVIHRKARMYGYYVLPGKNIIHAQYQWQPFLPNLFRRIFGLTYELGIKQRHIPAKELTIMAEQNTEYVLYYDHDIEDYVFEEYNK
jgi:hypothetical protein